MDQTTMPGHDFAMATSKGYETEKLKSESVSVLDQIDGEIARLSDVIDTANARLYKVISPEYDNDKAAGMNPAPIMSPIVETRGRLSYQIQRLIELLDRVEV